MGWWAAAAGLTPVHAWDARAYIPGVFTDLIGSNALAAGGALQNATNGYLAVPGNSNPMALATAIDTAADGVFMLFGAYAERFICFYKQLSDTGNYLLGCEANLLWRCRKDGGVFFEGGAVPAGSLSGEPLFAAVALDGGNARIYANGGWSGIAFDRAAYIPSAVGGIGWSGNGNQYNISANERFMAAGHWRGKASLADLQALEAACRAALEAPPFAARYAADPRMFVPLHPFWNRPQMGFDTVVKDQMQPIHRSHKGRVVGTLFAKGEPSNTPMQRKLRCFDEATGTLLAEGLSDAAGNYVFLGLDPTRRVFVVAFDDEDHYRAVIADKLLPQLGA